MATRAADASRDASRDDGSAETTVIFRVAETATRLKHRVSLVATLPAVRRLRNFLNPHSRLPTCDKDMVLLGERYESCLLYTSPSPRDRTRSRMPSSA